MKSKNWTRTAIFLLFLFSFVLFFGCQSSPNDSDRSIRQTADDTDFGPTDDTLFDDDSADDDDSTDDALDDDSVEDDDALDDEDDDDSSMDDTQGDDSDDDTGDDTTDDTMEFCEHPMTSNREWRTDPAHDGSLQGDYEAVAMADLIETSIAQLGNDYLLLMIRVNALIPLYPTPHEGDYIVHRWAFDLDLNPDTGPRHDPTFGVDAEIEVRFSHDFAWHGWWCTLKHLTPDPAHLYEILNVVLPMAIQDDRIYILTPIDFLRPQTPQQFRYLAETFTVMNLDDNGHLSGSYADSAPDPHPIYTIAAVDPVPKFDLITQNPRLNRRLPTTPVLGMEPLSLNVVSTSPSGSRIRIVDPSKVRLFSWNQNNFLFSEEEGAHTGRFSQVWEVTSYTHIAAYVEGCEALAPLLVIQGDLYEGSEGDVILPHDQRVNDGSCTLLAQEMMDTYEVNTIFDYGIRIMSDAFENWDGFYLGDKPILTRSGQYGGEPGQPLKLGFGVFYQCDLSPGDLQSPWWFPIFHEFAHNFAYHPAWCKFMTRFGMFVEPFASMWANYIAGKILYEDPASYPLAPLTVQSWEAVWSLSIDQWTPFPAYIQGHPELTFAMLTDGSHGPYFDAFHYLIGTTYGWQTLRNLGRILMALDTDGVLEQYLDGLLPDQDYNWDFYAAALSTAAGEDLFDLLSETWRFPLDLAHYSEILASLQSYR